MAQNFDRPFGRSRFLDPRFREDDDEGTGAAFLVPLLAAALLAFAASPAAADTEPRPPAPPAESCTSCTGSAVKAARIRSGDPKRPAPSKPLTDKRKEPAQDDLAD